MVKQFLYGKFRAESAGSTLVFFLINFGGELLAVIEKNQPDQFPYIILLGHSMMGFTALELRIKLRL